MALSMLDPAPSQELVAGWELVATEAGRSNRGLSATIALYNGTPQDWQTLAFSDLSARQTLSAAFAAQVGQAELTSEQVGKALIKLASAVEGALREMENAEQDGGESQATKLVRLVEHSGVKLFHTSDLDAYGSIPVNGHIETYPLRVKGFRLWLAELFFKTEKRTPASQSVQDAINVLEGQACFESPELPVYVRVAEHDRNIYLDLCNEAWQAVEVTPTGWRVMDRPPVKFRRMPGMLPLPVPVTGGTLTDLRSFLNLGRENQEGDWRLIVHWLIAAFRPRGPYPILVVHGGHGSAKSTLVRVLRFCLDPNAAPLRLPPKDVQNVAIASCNSWMVAYDNISTLSQWLSDTLCCVSTGLGFATRTLFMNSDESIFQAMRPIVVNGIEEVATRADFLDRAIIVHLPSMDPKSIKDEETFWAEVGDARPRMLGALLDIVCQGLQALPKVKLSSMPRMADFTKWSCATASACGWSDQDFLKAYQDARESTHTLTLEASVLWPPLQNLLQNADKKWTGTPTALLAALATRVDEDIRKQKEWPKKPNICSNQLRRLIPTLKEVGILVIMTHGKDRNITITNERQSQKNEGSLD